jgi:hypothetical protein
LGHLECHFGCFGRACSDPVHGQPGSDQAFVRSLEIDGQQDHPGKYQRSSSSPEESIEADGNLIPQVALDGLDNILKIGELDKEAEGAGAFNAYAVYIEEAGGMVSHLCCVIQCRMSS